MTKINNTFVINAASALQFDEPDGSALDTIVDTLPYNDDVTMLAFFDAVIKELNTRPHRCSADNFNIFAIGALAAQRRRFPDKFDVKSLKTSIPGKLLKTLKAESIKNETILRTLRKHRELLNIDSVVSVTAKVYQELVGSIGPEAASFRSRFVMSLVLSEHYYAKIVDMTLALGDRHD